MLFISSGAIRSFTARMSQFATLAAKYGVATAYSIREFPEAGGLMSYGTDLFDLFHHLGAYTGQIKGAKPADLPGGAIDSGSSLLSHADSEASWH